jgi:hypothetical protein
LISKDDIYLWKNDPVTQAWFEACRTRAADAAEILVETAGVDSQNDNFYRGFIKAYAEMTDFSVEDANQ